MANLTLWPFKSLGLPSCPPWLVSGGVSGQSLDMVDPLELTFQIIIFNFSNTIELFLDYNFYSQELPNDKIVGSSFPFQNLKTVQTKA